MQWKSLANLLPRREFQDLADEEPPEDEVEEPALPSEPDGETWLPQHRARSKRGLSQKSLLVVDQYQVHFRSMSMIVNDRLLQHLLKRTRRLVTLARKKAIQDECQPPLVSLFLVQKVCLDKCLLLTTTS